MPELGSIEDRERKLLMYGEEAMPTATEDLEHYLRGEFQQGVPFRIAAGVCDAVGRKLSEREVSRLEVLSAIKELRYRQRRVLEMLYIDNADHQTIRQALDISERELYRERNEGLKAMTDVIYEWRN